MKNVEVRMLSRPPERPCPCCAKMMPPMMADGGYAPPGFEAEYDHYWCEDCAEAFDFDEVEQ